jgi:invasion protein IalB
MNAFGKALACTLVLTLPGWAPALAQSSSDQPPAASETGKHRDREAGRRDEPKDQTSAAPAPVSSEPQMTTASFGDWVERCQRVAGALERAKVCEVAQTIRVEGQSGPIAQIAIGRLKKGDPLKVKLILPVNVAFPSAPKIGLDKKGDALELTWRRCLPVGCTADAEIGDNAPASWRAAANGQIESKTASGQDFRFAMSFRGLPQALDALAREP